MSCCTATTRVARRACTPPTSRCRRLPSAATPTSTCCTQLARQGDGRYYFAEHARDIPRLMTRETNLATRGPLVEGDVTPRQVGARRRRCPSSPPGGLPPLGGYLVTTPKDLAEVLLVSDAADPLLARWQYGLGRAVAWTSDLRGRWSAALAAWPGMPRLFGALVGWTIPPGQGPLQVDCRATRTPTGARARRPSARARMRACAPAWRSRAAQPLDVDLAASGPGRYEGEFPLEGHRHVPGAGRGPARRQRRRRDRRRRYQSRTRPSSAASRPIRRGSSRSRAPAAARCSPPSTPAARVCATIWRRCPAAAAAARAAAAGRDPAADRHRAAPHAHLAGRTRRLAAPPPSHRPRLLAWPIPPVVLGRPPAGYPVTAPRAQPSPPSAAPPSGRFRPRDAHAGQTTRNKAGSRGRRSAPRLCDGSLHEGVITPITSTLFFGKFACCGARSLVLGNLLVVVPALASARGADQRSYCLRSRCPAPPGLASRRTELVSLVAFAWASRARITDT